LMEQDGSLAREPGGDFRNQVTNCVESLFRFYLR
jgi:hypothetical protein